MEGFVRAWRERTDSFLVRWVGGTFAETSLPEMGDVLENVVPWLNPIKKCEFLCFYFVLEEFRDGATFAHQGDGTPHVG